MRIAVIGPSYPFRGGIAHYTALLCSSLAGAHDVQLISLARQYPWLLFPGKTQTDNSAVRLAVDGAKPLVDSMNPVSWLRAVRAVRQHAPDLVIVQWWHPFFAPAFGFIASRCRRFTKVLFLCHNVLPHERGGPARALTKFALSRGDLFIVHSDEDMTNLKALVARAAVRKARHPTYEVFARSRRRSEAGRGNVEAQLRERSRRELELDAGSKVILFFGLVREYKGLKYLIQAMPGILASVDATLVIAGEFYDDREKYVQMVKELAISHKVKIRDQYVPNEEVATYFTAADLVVLPYVSATQSGIVQIAYGFGRPVVTTNVGGLPECVIDGKTGFVVPPADPIAMADAVVRFFAEDSADEFARNIREFREEFSWDRMVEAIESLAGGGGDGRC